MNELLLDKNTNLVSNVTFARGFSTITMNLREESNSNEKQKPKSLQMLHTKLKRQSKRFELHKEHQNSLKPFIKQTRQQEIHHYNNLTKEQTARTQH